MSPVFAGIGTREGLTDEQKRLIKRRSIDLANLGYSLRTGGATGADQQFLRDYSSKIEDLLTGVDLTKAIEEIEVYTPWNGFNGYNSDALCTVWNLDSCGATNTARLIKIASEIHPNWTNLKGGAKKLMARTVWMLMGWNLRSYVDLVVAAPRLYNDKPTGGTLFTIRAAEKLGIPVEIILP